MMKPCKTDIHAVLVDLYMQRNEWDLTGHGTQPQTTNLRQSLTAHSKRKSVTLKNREAALAEHCKNTGTYIDTSRVRVDGFGKGVSQKAVWANKNHLQNNEKYGTISYAKNLSFSYDEKSIGNHISPEQLSDELNKSQIGHEALEYISKNNIKPILNYSKQKHTDRGYQQGDTIMLYMDNIHSPLVAAQTLAHEVCHHQYGIGQSQWAETVCFAKEKMLKENRTTLTITEKRKLIQLAKEAYATYNWRKGGMINGRYV